MHTVRIRKGLSNTPEYKVWKEMIRRCTNHNHKRYAEWGGRGIGVCERWEVFSNFITDMGLRPTKGMSIERRDNNKGYNPENCYWATALEQNNNTKSNRLMSFMGMTNTLAVWARVLGLNYNTVRSRVYILGWSDHQALSVPIKYRQPSKIVSQEPL